MDFTDEQIKFIGADIQSDRALSKMIREIKERCKKRDQAFNKEFAAYKANKRMVKARAQFRIIEALRKQKKANNY